MNFKNLKWKLNFSQCFDQGGRNYMEDFCYSHIEKNDTDVLFGIFGIFDGHGGPEAASFVQKTLKRELVKIDKFWSNDCEEVAESIKLVYSNLQKLMWIERENWVRTISGYKSTAGTTASIVIIRNGVLYTGHVGDSGILLVYLDSDNILKTEELTQEHKPDNELERKRIEKSGGSLKRKGGIDRVVWNRKRCENSEEMDYIPFLAVARSLGDLWSYDVNTDSYHVSPEPDVKYFDLNTSTHRSVIIGSDGLWNVVNKEMSVKILRLCSYLNRNGKVYSPAQVLVNYSHYLWRKKNIKADNISAVVVLLQPDSIDPSTEVLQSLDDDEDLLNLHSELTSNYLLEGAFYHPPAALLGEFSDFSMYKAHNQLENESQNPIDQDVELLQQYMQSDSKFGLCIDPWQESSDYWQIFTKSLKQMGHTSFPKMIFYLETCTKKNIDDLMAALPWSVCCLDTIDSMKLTNRIKSFIQHQPFLTEFWTCLYNNIIGKNFNLVESQMSKFNAMKNVLISKSLEIGDWILSISLANSEFSDVNDSDYDYYRSKNSLRKYSTCSNGNAINNFFANHTSPSQNIYKCYQLKKSASFDLSKSNFFFGFRASLLPQVDDGSTTSINASSTDCELPPSPKKDSPVPITNDSRSYNVPSLSLKRKISNTELSELLFMNSKDQNPDVIQQKFALSRKKRLIL